MNWIEKRLTWCLIGTALVVLAQASIGGNESHDRAYEVIVDRNPFGLRPPPTNAPAPPTNQAKTNLKLTGFTTLGQKRAFFVWTDDRTKTNEPITLAIN